MKRVLFVTNIPVPYRIDFYNELGKEVDLTVVFEAKDASDQGIRFNYNLDTIRNFKAIFLSEENIKEKKVDWSIFKYLRKDYDTIVLTSYSYLTEMMALIYLKLRGIPYYLSSDGGIIKYGENKIKCLYKKFLISGAKGYFSPSNQADQYLNYYGAPKDKMYRYPFTSFMMSEQISSIPKEDEKRHIRENLGITKKYMVLGVGQFIHRKGWDLLIRAAAHISGDVCICIVGGVSDGSYEKIAAESGVKAEIQYLPFMDKERVNLYYQAADVFVLPTREDIWGLVINEAMNYGLPVISTTSCIAALELVHDDENGFIIALDDEKKAIEILADRLNLILQDSKLRKRYSEKSKMIIGKYSIEEMAKAYIDAMM